MSTAPIAASMRLQGYEPLYQSTIRGKFALGLGLALLAITAGLVWVAWGDLPAGVSRPSVSPMLFTIFSAGLFGAPGVFLLCVGAHDLRREAHVQRERKVHPGEPWRWDYAWQGLESKDIGLRQAFKGAGGVAMAVGIVLPISYFVFTEDAPIIAMVGVGLFDSLLLLSAGTVLYRIAAQIIHGRGRLTYAHFPLRLGQTTGLTLRTAQVLDDVEQLRCTLCCIQELSEARRGPSGPEHSGARTTVTKIGLQKYAEEQVVEIHGRAANEFPLVFELPADPALATSLSGETALHWELIVEGERPGVDLYHRFLLPVY